MSGVLLNAVRKDKVLKKGYESGNHSPQQFYS